MLRHLKMSNENRLPTHAVRNPTTTIPLPSPPPHKRQNQDRVVIVELNPRYDILLALRRSGFDKKKFHLGFFWWAKWHWNIFISVDVSFRW